MTFAYALIVIDVNRLNPPGNLRRNRNNMAVDEGVIRGLVGRRIDHVDQAGDHRKGKGQCDDKCRYDTLR